MNNKNKFLTTVLAVLLAAILAVPTLPVRAASYSGSGTKANPYLVTSAEQLQGMRDNLSAHYKLANTIDLQGVDFKPIGRLDSPFTGSFTCELNTDKTPKFVIKNLQMTVAESPYAAENKNKWEGGLFGATSGASVSGIYVLDAKITNHNFGDNTGSVVYNNYKPGMDEMPTGILIGAAMRSTIVNCATSGSVTGQASYCGGLIGVAENSSVKNCYSVASVATGGYWNVGGLLGSSENSNIVSCFSTGNVKGGQTNVSSFIGSASGGGSIVDCYTTGNATGVKEDSTNFVTLRDAAGLEISNCYTTGSITVNVKKNTEGKVTVKNSYTLNGKNSDMTGFTATDMDTIKAKIAGANWDTSGSTPVLVNVGIVKNAGAYQPGTADTGTSQVGTQGTSTTVQGQTSSGVSEEENIKKCSELITALPDPTEENAITLKNKDAVKEAWQLYDSLSTGTKEDFDATLSAKLMQARSQVSILLAADVVNRIEKLPSIKKLTLNDIDEIFAIWEDYNFLEDSVKKEIDESYINKLEKAHEYAQKNEGSTQTNVTFQEEGFSMEQKIIIGICIGLVVLAVAFNVFAGIMFFKRSKKRDEKVKVEREGTRND